MLVQCKDPKTSKIKIPGFYDDVVQLTKKDRAELAKIPHDDMLYARSIGATRTFGEKGYTVITSYSIHYTKLYELTPAPCIICASISEGGGSICDEGPVPNMLQPDNTIGRASTLTITEFRIWRFHFITWVPP